MEEEEIWKDIPKYEGVYQVSNFGNVKTLTRKIIDDNRIHKRVYIRQGKTLNKYFDKYENYIF